MSKYDIEVGENCEQSTCHCCGKKSCIGHGFVYKDDVAYAVYYAGWASAHADKKISFAIAVGEWSDDSTTDDRTCFGLAAYEDDKEIFFRIIEPDESPWAVTGLLGKMMSRSEGINHPLLKELFLIAEKVVRSHKAIRKYLAIPKS